LCAASFLQKLTSTKSSNTLQQEAFSRAFSLVSVSGRQQMLAESRGMRSFLVDEGEDAEALNGSKRRAKKNYSARYASFIYLGKCRYGFCEGLADYFGCR